MHDINKLETFVNFLNCHILKSILPTKALCFKNEHCLQVIVVHSSITKFFYILTYFSIDSCNEGWVVSHEDYVSKAYKGKYQLRPSLFNISNPFKMKKKKSSKYKIDPLVF